MGSVRGAGWKHERWTSSQETLGQNYQRHSTRVYCCACLATFGSPEKAQHWMNRPNPLFQGKTPAQVIELDLIQVEAELVRIDHGVYM